MIFYSHVNEDNDLEKQFMDTGTFQKLVCIAGSGERVIALMAHPALKRVSAVDISIEALFLLELKLKALENLGIEDYLKFTGFSDSKARWQLFDLFKKKLSPHCLKFWNHRPKAIREGILFHGHFERYLQRFRPSFKAFLGKSFYKCFYHPFQKIEDFPHWRWQLLKKIFSKRWAFILGGNKDLAFISQDAQRERIPQGLQTILEENLVRKSFMFHLIFKGHLKEISLEFLPLSFKVAHLDLVKKKLEKGHIEVSYQHKDLKAYLQAIDYQENEDTFYSFSDFLSFCDFSYLESLIRLISKKKEKEHWGVFRAFLRHRLDEVELELLQKKLKDITETSPLEKTKMYQVFTFKI